MKRFVGLFGLVITLASIGLGQDRPPDLVAIKAAAEAGDPVAQFEYANAIPIGSRPSEQVEWYFKSARAGYAPAQDAIGKHFTALEFNKQKRSRQPARVSALVQPGGLSGRHLVAGAHRRVLPGWLGAAKGSGLPRTFGTGSRGTRAPSRSAFSVELNRLITEMSSAEIAEAESRLKSFRLEPYSGLNPVEADMLFAAAESQRDVCDKRRPAGRSGQRSLQPGRDQGCDPLRRIHPPRVPEHPRDQRLGWNRRYVLHPVGETIGYLAICPPTSVIAVHRTHHDTRTLDRLRFCRLLCAVFWRGSRLGDLENQTTSGPAARGIQFLRGPGESLRHRMSKFILIFSFVLVGPCLLRC